MDGVDASSGALEFQRAMAGARMTSRRLAGRAVRCAHFAAACATAKSAIVKGTPPCCWHNRLVIGGAAFGDLVRAHRLAWAMRARRQIDRSSVGASIAVLESIG